MLVFLILVVVLIAGLVYAANAFEGHTLICPSCKREVDPYHGKSGITCQWCGWKYTR